MELIKNFFPIKSSKAVNMFQIMLAHKNLTSLPREIIPVEIYINVLDLSNNEISDVAFLAGFKNLEILVMDHNKINTKTVFPKLPKLKTLWLNHNEIGKVDIVEFLYDLSRKCPKLEVLSLLENEGAVSCKQAYSIREILIYRYFVISQFPNLIYLDDGPVTAKQRAEAITMFDEPNVLGLLRVKYLEFANLLSHKQRDNFIV